MSLLQRLNPSLEPMQDAQRGIMLRMIRMGAWLLVTAIAIATLSPLKNRPRLSIDAQTERGIAFFALGFAFSLAYPERRGRVLTGIVACAFALEAAQRLTPDRHGELPDAFAKAFGGVLGVLAVGLAQRLAPRARPTSEKF